MNAKATILTFKKMVKAAPQQIYNAFTNSTALREWMCDVATTDPKIGGRLYVAWNAGFYAAGHFTRLEKDREIGFTWQGLNEPSSTEVHVHLSGAEGSTRVHLEHCKLGMGEEWDSVREAMTQGWLGGLDNLASVLETGEDLRFVNRPMLGIGVSDFDEKIAHHMVVPVTEGIRIDSAIEGMGAAAAGLQGNDVIVSLAGYPITNFASVTAALSGKKAGDTVEVIFYRGADKKSLPMKLSHRPLPEIPWNAKALAEAVSQRNTEIHQELDQFLQGVTEEEASYRPAPTEWCIKEVLAHLIHGERSRQTFIVDLMGGQEPIYDNYSGNVKEQVEATVATFPALAAIYSELRHASQETVEFIARLPDEFLERKGSYWRLAYGELESPYHHQIHMEQMHNALKAARMS
jgi:uncharacterized protein YndB with AHSA1/START domain